MAVHGGKRAGAGRKPGVVSQVKRDLAELAKDHAEAALKALVSIVKDVGAPPAARVSAANAILDRGYGKPAQSVALSNPDGALTPQPTHIIIEAATDDDSADQAAAETGAPIQ